MIALLLLLFSAQAYGPGMVRVDTLSVLIPMAQFRAATAVLVDDSLASAQVAALDSIHRLDKAALTELRSALTTCSTATAVEHKAFVVTDSARKACVVAAAAIKAEAEKSSFRSGFTWGSGIFGSISVVTLLVGLYLGTQIHQ